MSDIHMPGLRRARTRDWAAIRALLLDSELPVDDLAPDKLDEFLVAVDADEIVGLIGLEVIGKTGLLRSLVVAGDARRAGLGGKLVGALESAAQTAGIESLWLLTIDAEQFFERQGFAIVGREQVPGSIRQTEEFSDICPDSAHLMVKYFRISPEIA